MSDGRRPQAAPDVAPRSLPPAAVVRPEIELPGDLERASREAWAAIGAWRSDADADRFVGRFGGTLARLEQSDEGTLGVRPLDRRRMVHLLARAADFGRRARDAGWVSAPPPRTVADDVLVDPAPPVPVLERVVQVPVLSPDGAVHERPGYNAGSRCFYSPAAGLRVPAVPDRPAADEVAEARALLVDELLGDFPFNGPGGGQSERAHAVAAALLPFLRGLIDGPTPLHLVEAPTPGTGKSLLVEAVMVALLGPQPLPRMAEARDPDEWRKRLVAKFRSAPTVLCIDNLQDRLDSSALALAVTSSVIEDRLLGVSETVTLPVRAVWLATGNNPRLSDELTRRCVRIRLDAGVEFPEQRGGFRHPDLLAWARENRGRLIWAALTLGRAWIAAGRPDGHAPPFGGFETWRRVMAGVLEHAGIPGLLGNVAELRTAADDDGGLGALLAGIWATRDRRNGDGVEFTTRGVLPLAREHLGLDGDDARVLQRTGVRLREAVDRPRHGLVLRRGSLSAGTRRWRIEPLARVGEGE